jgi:hypothetical protein
VQKELGVLKEEKKRTRALREAEAVKETKKRMAYDLLLEMRRST